MFNGQTKQIKYKHFINTIHYTRDTVGRFGRCVQRSQRLVEEFSGAWAARRILAPAKRVLRLLPRCFFGASLAEGFPGGSEFPDHVCGRGDGRYY